MRFVLVLVVVLVLENFSVFDTPGGMGIVKRRSGVI